MKFCKYISVLFALLCLVIENTAAQNLSELNKQKAFRLSGGISANSVLYHVDGIKARRDPFYWMLNGNITVSVYEVDIPISLTLSQQNNTFTQPFNQFGMSPKYKNFTLHLGFRSLNFSEYSLAGIIFLGGGFEWIPQKTGWRASGMYGRFQRAVQVGNQIGIVSGNAAYERWGYGAKLGYGNMLNHLDVFFFKAKDDANSIDRNRLIANGTDVSPSENFIMGGVFKKAIYKKLSAYGEYALSAYTNDQSAPEASTSGFTYANVSSSFITPRTSSQFNGAYHLGATYNQSLYSIGARYTRIDPQYRSMGAIYLQNDREDVTANLVLRLFKSKLTLSTNGGIQRNNLDKKQISTMYRVIALLNAMYVINDKWSLIGTYSNFNSNSIINTAPLGVNVDSLRYFQVTNSYSGTVNYATGNNRIKHVYTINSTYQKASDPYTSGSAFYASNASYQFQLIPKNLTITTSVNFNQNSFSGQQYRAYGPGVTLQKYYLNKRIRALAAMSYILNENYGTNGTTMNNRLGCAYRAGDHHLFSVDLNWLKNTSSKTLNYTFNEYRGGLTYTLSF